MISSMTGYGRGEASEKRITATAEVRSVNNRYLEVSSRLPRTMSLRENEVKEIVRSKLARGKVNVVISVAHGVDGEMPQKINREAARAAFRLLTDLKKSVKLTEKVTLEHLLKFPEVIDTGEFDRGDDQEWELVRRALGSALDDLAVMRRREGEELRIDLVARVRSIESVLDTVEALARTRVPQARTLLEARLKELVTDPSVLDARRLELELALYADKLDITEECVRFRSHNKFFLKALGEEEAAGRKLTFLVQEMNREANTIGSKANEAETAHLIVGIKEELEKIREQLQNIE